MEIRIVTDDYSGDRQRVYIDGILSHDSSYIEDSYWIELLRQFGATVITESRPPSWFKYHSSIYYPKGENVIFLDIDGVVTTESTNFKRLDLTAVKNLERAIQLTNARVVISSARDLSEILDFTTEYAILTSRRITDVLFTVTGTQGLLIRASKAKEIQDYLDAHPEIGNYLIIDDELSGHKTFQIDSILGLTAEDTERIVEYFNA